MLASFYLFIAVVATIAALLVPVAGSASQSQSAVIAARDHALVRDTTQGGDSGSDGKGSDDSSSGDSDD